MKNIKTDKRNLISDKLLNELMFIQLHELDLNDKDDN